jgi:DDE_Tnp_1-associated
MSTNLVEVLQSIKDHRKARGQRYPLWLLLLTAILAVLSGAKSLRGLERFSQRHFLTLCQRLNVSVNPQRTPADSTFRLVFEQVDLQAVQWALCVWSERQSRDSERESLICDGKAARGSVISLAGKVQNFISIISAYCPQQGLVVAQASYPYREDCEQHALQRLLKTLDLEGVLIQADALHTQKN